MRHLIAILSLIMAATVPATAQPSSDDRAFFIAAFQTAQDYGADMSLILYCFRHDEVVSGGFTLGIVSDLNDVAELARQGAIDGRRTVEFIRQTLAAVHFPALDADDPKLEAACKARHVVEDVQLLKPIAWPLKMRAPFARN